MLDFSSTENIKEEVNPRPEDELFYTGRVFPDGKSKFIKSNLGIREIRGVPKYVAEWLHLENPEKYTGMNIVFF